mgnify:CR=1 FL=1
MKKAELMFKLDEDFIEITADGRRATSKEEWEIFPQHQNKLYLKLSELVALFILFLIR